MSPLAEYQARREQRQAAAALLTKQFLQIGNWRLVVAVAAAVLAWLAWGKGVVSGWILLAPVVVFIGLMVWHQRVIRERTLRQRAVQFYQAGIQRLEDRWSGTGSQGEEFRDSEHVYADDLDIFGKGSLFELLSRARTGPGERTLANWLLRPATRAEAHERQRAVQELTGRLDLREDMALLGEDVRSRVHPEQVAAWGSQPAINFSPAIRPLALALTGMGIVFLVLFFGHVIPLWPLLGVVIATSALTYVVRQRVEKICEGIEAPSLDLQVLSLVLERLERESFECEWLRRVHGALQTQGQSASRRIAKLSRLMELLDSSDHQVVRVLHPILLWRIHCALAVEAWRRENGPQVGRWLQAVGEFEAASSLASLAFERPDWAMPVLADEGATFHAAALRHPLLAPAKCVPNDVAIDSEQPLLIISGSNMSGKSTLLRAIGLNTVLAWAGAPVAAAELTVSLLSVGASMRTVDSLQDNRSRFMAEITRLRQIVDLTKLDRPALFLLDELLSGTNSHDRRIGAAAIVKNLVAGGAIGLITTHDLALADIQSDLGAKAVNAHFEDAIVNGHMEFDYRLRPGVVTRSNALELMRAVGLAV